MRGRDARRRADAPASPRVATARPSVLVVFEQPDLLAPCLLLAAAPTAFFVTKRVARDARALALVVGRFIWKDRIAKGNAILKGHTGKVRSCAFSPDGERVVTASDGGLVRLWDAETGALQATLEEHTGPVTSCAFSPDGKRLVTAGGDRMARLWDAETGAQQLTLVGHTSSVNCCAFSPNGTRIATASDDGTARLWDAL